MVALSTVALYASYGLPILAGVLARRSGRWLRRGPWNLGSFSNAVNIVALGWTLFIMVLFVLPPNELAGITFLVALAVIAALWVLGVRKRFRGPPPLPNVASTEHAVAVEVSRG
jgi:amino acid transporter